MNNLLDKPIQFNFSGTYKGFKYFSLFIYYPKGQLNNKSEDDIIINKFIWDFKNPIYWLKSAEIVGIAMEKKFGKEELKKWTFSIIPSSTKNKTSIRFEEFVKTICKIVDVKNGYGIINVKQNHKPLKGRKVKNKIEFFEFKKTQLPENLFLFDDVINSGETFYQCAIELKNCGVKQIIGIMLGKTPIKSEIKKNKY